MCYNEYMDSLKTQLNYWAKKPFFKKLKDRFKTAEVFLVGGAVRDLILGRLTADFDFVIRNVSINDLQKFLQKYGTVNLVGKRFGVLKFRPKSWAKEDLDIALPRTEHSINFSGAYRDFKIKSNAKLKIADDLSRRDFTINAMAWDVFNQKLIDPLNGLSDLKQGLIKAVGAPATRFAEDYSRMLRAVRFGCQLNFSIDKETFSAIQKNIPRLNRKVGADFIVAREVIAKELFKMVKADPVLALELLDKTGALKVLMPELLKLKNCPQPKNFHSEGDVWKHTILSLTELESKNFKKEFKGQIITPEVLWGLIFHDLGKPYTILMADRIRFNNHDNVSAKKFGEIASRLKLSSAGLNVEATQKIISKHMLITHAKMNTIKQTTLEKYFFNDNFPGQKLLMLIFCDVSATVPPSGKPDFSDYLSLKTRLKNLTRKIKNKKVLPKPIVNGNDLIKNLKLKEGPQIGKLLEILREAQLKNKIKTKKDGLKLAKK